MLNTQIGAKKSWNGQYQVECSKVPDMPDFTFYYDGTPYPIKSTDYILNVQGTCISSFTGMDLNIPGGDLWIVGECFCYDDTCECRAQRSFFSGDVFLRKYYTVYDLGRNAVGFAKSK
jgi:saccharopepsin